MQVTKIEMQNGERLSVCIKMFIDWGDTEINADYLTKVTKE